MHICLTVSCDTSRYELPQHECTSIDVNLKKVLNAEVDGAVKNFRRHVPSCANLHVKHQHKSTSVTPTITT